MIFVCVCVFFFLNISFIHYISVPNVYTVANSYYLTHNICGTHTCTYVKSSFLSQRLILDCWITRVHFSSHRGNIFCTIAELCFNAYLNTGNLPFHTKKNDGKGNVLPNNEAYYYRVGIFSGDLIPLYQFLFPVYNYSLKGWSHNLNLILSKMSLLISSTCTTKSSVTTKSNVTYKCACTRMYQLQNVNCQLCWLHGVSCNVPTYTCTCLCVVYLCVCLLWTRYLKTYVFSQSTSLLVAAFPLTQGSND